MTKLKNLLCLLLLSVEISESFTTNPLIARPCIAPGASSVNRNSCVNRNRSRRNFDEASSRPRRWDVKLPASSELSDESTPKKKKKSRIVTTVWVHVASIFIVANYRSRCWPAFLTSIPLATWNLIHAISGMLFAGSIITTTIIEWLVVSSREEPVNRFWFQQVPKVEQMVVLPALTGSILSGVAQAFLTYDSLRQAPRHVKSSLHLLFLFGLWWGVTDRKTQAKAQQAVSFSEVERSRVPTVMQQRRISNVVSCVFLAALYVMMVLKPGFQVI